MLIVHKIYLVFITLLISLLICRQKVIKFIKDKNSKVKNN